MFALFTFTRHRYFPNVFFWLIMFIENVNYLEFILEKYQRAVKWVLLFVSCSHYQLYHVNS